MQEPRTLEDLLVHGMADQVSKDMDWAFLNTRWVWGGLVPLPVRWICNRNRALFWIARRLKMGEWYCPDPPWWSAKDEEDQKGL